MSSNATDHITQRNKGRASPTKRTEVRVEKTRKDVRVIAQAQRSIFEKLASSGSNYQGVLDPINATPRSQESQRAGSPLDKPLPSLPIATIVSKSPVNRRSLIDCAERPLRRSLSPQPGKMEVEEDWPALSPERPGLSNQSASKATGIKPSLGESVIEGFSNLHLGDEATSFPQLSESFKQSLKNELPVTKRSPSAESETSAGQGRTLHVRHTRTSLMREQLSSSQRHQGGRGQTPPVSIADPTVTTTHSNDLNDTELLKPSAIGPVRSNSKAKYGVSGRGSPYMIPVRSTSKSDQNQGNMHVTGRRPLSPVSVGALNASTRPGNINSRPGTDDGNKIPRSPSKSAFLKHEGTTEDGVAAVDTQENVASFRDAATLQDDDSDAESIHKQSGRSRSESFETVCHNIDSGVRKATPRKPSPFPFLAGMNDGDEGSNTETVIETPDDLEYALREAEYDQEHEGESLPGHAPSQYHFSQGDTYRVKHLSLHSPETGPLLRISQEADEVIMGKTSNGDAQLNLSATKTAADLRQSVILREHFRRSIGSPDQTIASKESKVEPAEPTKPSEDEYTHDETANSDGSSETFVMVRVERDVDGEDIHYTHDPASGDDDSGSVIFKKEELEEEEPKLPKTESIASDWPLKRAVEPAYYDRATSTAVGLPNSSVPDFSNRMITPITRAVQQTPTPQMSYSTPLTQGHATHQHVKEASENLREDLCNSRAFSHSALPVRNSSLLASSPWVSSASRYRANEASPVVSPPSTGRTASHFSRLPRPVHGKTFSESIRDIDAKFDETIAAKSTPPKTARGVVSGIRGLFHKRSQILTSSSSKKPGTFRSKHRPFISSPLQADSTRNKTTLSSPPGNSGVTPLSSNRGTESPAFTTSVLEPVEIREAARVAFDLLDLARETTNTNRALELVKIGKAMVHVLTTARNAEKASEQAKQAAVKAEMMCMQTRTALGEMTRCVEAIVEDSS